jgi:hypothetical protein
MKNYLRPDGSLWAFEDDGSQDEFIASDMTPISEQEAMLIINRPAPKADRISLLQAVYDNDRNKLNQAWLSAMIADGVDEAARKAVIVEHMTALDVQLEADILAIVMEE